MIDKQEFLPKLIAVLKALLSSLHLKDVLEAAVIQLQALSNGAKVSLFLSDNERLSLKLMSSRGYSENSLVLMRVLPFTADSLLKAVIQKRMLVTVSNYAEAPEISRAVMINEASHRQVGIPLISANLLLGVVLFDFPNDEVIPNLDFLRDLADVLAIIIADAILYGRSEYERQRLSTLYKTSCVLASSALKIKEILQIILDTVAILGNTNQCAVLMFDKAKDGFNLAAVKGLAGTSLNEFETSAQGTLAGRCLSSGKVECILNNSQQIYGVPLSSSGGIFKSILALPMKFKEEPLGVVLAFACNSMAFAEEHVELLQSFVNQASSALHVALAHESLSSQLVLDAHTELYNRWHFEELLKKEIERAQRHKRRLALLLIDVDHLASINQHLGQEKGDEAIRHIARILKGTLRDIDFSCRFGGDEFAVILPETSQQSALEVADRLRLKIKSESIPGIGTVTVSVGVSIFPNTFADMNQLIKAAEQARDVAKFEGRDRVKEAGSESQAKDSWEQLASKAKLSVMGERQAKDKSNAKELLDHLDWLRGGYGST